MLSAPDLRGPGFRAGAASGGRTVPTTGWGAERDGGGAPRSTCVPLENRPP